ncbi:ABC transporter substrate-binding protein [Dehalobacter sp. DCM]|uniref:ABC transporter substrate-binding protein n=1 Tax=Dehalobacter sp. DCM TaxID=2907827 RepID=UPI0030819EB5|nr:ABC transporter substrate-binding protein [Dehalobacter sp. DCM]
MKSKKFTQFLALSICLVLGLLSLVGCSAKSASTDNSSKQTAAVQLTKIVDGKREFTDMMGNQCSIPAEVKKVYCTSPIGTYMVYTVDPDKLIGWNSKMTEDALQYINEKYRDLPVLGGNMGGKNTYNTEYIISLKPDIILSIGQKGQNIASIQKLSEQTGIPVVNLDYSLTATEQAYRLLGEILGQSERANMLADYVKESLDRTKSMVSKVPDDKKVKVYYAESADGLSTDGSDSMHTEVLNFVNAANVVTLETSAQSMGTEVSMEQILNWNPEVIIVNSMMGGDDFLKTVNTDSKWSSISAVKNNRIYKPAALPFGWFDRPPCMARVIGAEWLASVLYPEYVQVDLKSDVKAFYKTFYQVDITDVQATALINGGGEK